MVVTVAVRKSVRRWSYLPHERYANKEVATCANVNSQKLSKSFTLRASFTTMSSMVPIRDAGAHQCQQNLAIRLLSWRATFFSRVPAWLLQNLRILPSSNLYLLLLSILSAAKLYRCDRKVVHRIRTPCLKHTCRKPSTRQAVSWPMHAERQLCLRTRLRLTVMLLLHMGAMLALRSSSSMTYLILRHLTWNSANQLSQTSRWVS
mmetsp:Transcript_32474/g.110318  ORF Transcript_32474/g.110318 Transcript_32474/m.110318 type:complete len:205 (-) Transcript_32474:735-1349(-)